MHWRRALPCLAAAAALAACGDGVGGRFGGEEEARFTDIGAGLTGVRDGCLAWGDYDGDGQLDLALAGESSGGRVSVVYRNQGGAFTDIVAGLTAVSACSLAWGDYDSDADLDLALGGYSPVDPWYISMIYGNDGAGLTDINAGLEAICMSAAAWGDYDNDGDLDLALADGGGSRLYENDAGLFTDSGAGLADLDYSSLAWGDYDNDGDLDLALAGYEGATLEFKTMIYNNESGVFTDIDAGLFGVCFASLAWGDYDSDGDLDLALAGFNGYAVAAVCKVYRNDGGAFTDVGAALAGQSSCSLAWGDYDNDGDLDLAVAGFSGGSRLYRNDGGEFTDVGGGLIDVSDSSLAWGDYDNDGDLDLVLCGEVDWPDCVATVYRNDTGIRNTIPAAPSGLTAAVSGLGPYEVAFSWDPATDAETPRQSLTYNLRVGTTPGGNEVVPSMAITSPGRRLVPAMGNVQLNTSWTVKNLDADTYYWSVQAVDTAYAGGAWAPEETLFVP